MRLITFQPNRKLVSIRPFYIFLATIFLVLFADSIMSYYFPLVVENNINSNTIVGIVMALSSMVGLACDLIFPQLFQKKTWKFLLVAGIIVSITFPIVVNLGIAFASISVFLLASIMWGIYYEFLSFSQQSFVISTESRDSFSKDWGLVSIITGLGSLVGPIVGSLLVRDTLVNSATIIVALQFMALIFAILLISSEKRGKKIEVVEEEIKMSISRELIYWFVLLKRIWPPIVVGLAMTFISASFWTIGPLFGQQILGDSGLDWLIVVIFIIPTIPGAIILSRLKIIKHKKIISEIGLLFSGISMACIFLVQNNIVIVLFLVLLLGLFLSFTWPLNEAVYSDITDRAGDKKLHVTAITRANTSIGYVVGPIMAGFIADKTDYFTAFSIVGLIVLVISALLIVFTPRKLKLPQSKLAEIEAI
ncbi:MAG: MFS transporter [Candidatus Dojkabacteria bacterium]